MNSQRIFFSVCHLLSRKDTVELARLETTKPESNRQHIQNIQELRLAYLQLLNVLDLIKRNNDPRPEKEVDFEGRRLEAGYYLECFLKGVDNILHNLNNDLTALEVYLLDNYSSSILSGIEKVQKYLSTIKVIRYLLLQVLDEREQGPRLIDICYHHVYCGSEEVQIQFTGLHQLVMRPLLMQIKCWVLYAELIFGDEEFFIQRKPFQKISCSYYSSATMLTSYSQQVEEVIEFEINRLHLPSCIPHELAVKMLYIGDSIVMCSSNPANKQCRRLDVLQLCGITKEKFSEEFGRIGNDDLTLRGLSPIIENIWDSVNAYIYKLAKDEGDFFSQFQMMCDMYLLHRGEVLQEFLEHAGEILDGRASAVSCRSLTSTLENAAYDVYLTESVEFCDKFFFTIPNREELKGTESAWTNLRLDCKLNWPLHRIFTAEVITNYNKIFFFLLKLKQVQVKLNATWLLTRKFPNSTKLVRIIPLQQLLISIFCDLQNYFNVDVIQCELDYLVNLFKYENRFTAVQNAHSLFLLKIMNALYLPITNLTLNGLPFKSEAVNESSCPESEEIHSALLQIVDVAERFVFDVKNTDSDFDHLSQKCLIHEKRVKGILRFLTKTLQNKTSTDSQGLMLHLDFNEYYKRTLL